MNGILPECSFCGRGESEVEFLMPGLRGVFICSRCLEQSSELPTNLDAAASCGFCGRKQGEVSKLSAGKNASICSDCIFVWSSPPAVMIRSGFIISPETRIGNWLLNSKSRFIRKYIIGGK